MRIPTILLVVAACAPAVHAQLPTTSPKGLASTEGNASFFASTNRRYMGIDATLRRDLLINIKAFSLRRDSAQSSGSASTVDATLTMGETDMAVVYSELDRNITANKTLVFPKKNVSWPSWSTGPAPSPFDFTIPLATPYNKLSATRALVWDLVLENGTYTGNSFDRHFTFYTTGTASNLGAGCASFTLNTTLQSNGPALPSYGMRMVAGVTNAPAAAPVHLSIALTDANATIPGFCTKVHADPLIIVPLGVANSSGRVYDCYFSAPYDATLNGARLVTQAFSITGGNLALTNGRDSLMPTSTASTGDEACYLWTTVTSLPHNSTVFSGGSIIAEFK